MADPSTAEPLEAEHEPLTTEGSHEAPSTTDRTAPPSGAEKSETKETLLEAVLKAVKPAEDADESETLAGTSPPSEQATTGADAKGEGDKTDLSKDPSQDELSAYNKRTRERVEQLIGQRNAFRAEAEVTQTLRNFLVTNDIAREDFQLTLDLAAAMRRGDFKGFLEGVGPYVQLATQAMGISLPADLEAEVRAQKMTFDTAAQMSRDRYARALAEQRATRATQIMGNQQTTQQTQHLQRSIESTVANWEAGIRQTDPDYGRKEETVRQLLWSVVNEQGGPKSPEHAVEIAKEAYARANRSFAQFAPQRPATKAVPSSTSTTAPRQAHARNRAP